VNILFNFINHSSAIDGTDYRAQTFEPLLYLLRDKGHQIWIDPHKKPGHPSFKPFKQLLKDFPTFSEKNIKSVQLWIVPYPHARKKPRYKYLKKKKVPILSYEHGWLNKSVFVDLGGMFSDAYFADSIANMVNENFNKKECTRYKKQLLSENISKRPQKGDWKSPKDIDHNYIFIPIQKLNDVSMQQYSKTGMLDFITETVKFAKERNLPVILKQHPHTTEDHKTVEKHVRSLKKNYRAVYLVNASIYYLMQHARFTACVNSGSVVDNFVTETPVFCAGESFFLKSGTIIFNENIKQGLNTMFDQNYNWDEIKQKQTKTLWWLKNNLLFSSLDPIGNLQRLSNNCAISL